MSDKLTALQAKLKDAGYSLTKPRKEVFNALQDKEAQTMHELIAALPGIDRATTYRTIELYTKIGIVERLQVGWKYKLELSDEFSHHHHHITCTHCHNTIPLDENQELESILHKMAEKIHFTATSHQLEIRGLCQNCST